MSTPAIRQPHDLRRLNRGALVLRIELHRLDPAAAMDVGSELVALRHAPHGGHDAVADHERSDVATLALSDESLQQHVVIRALECLDDRRRDFVVRGGG